MITLAQCMFREFNRINEEFDISLCDSLFADLIEEFDCKVERLVFNGEVREGIYVELVDNQEIIITVYNGEVTLWVHLHSDVQDLVGPYGLRYCPNEIYEYQGFCVTNPEELATHVRLILETQD